MAAGAGGGDHKVFPVSRFALVETAESVYFHVFSWKKIAYSSKKYSHLKFNFLRRAES